MLRIEIKGCIFTQLVRYIISFSIILSSVNAHQQCWAVNLCSKQSRFYSYWIHTGNATSHRPGMHIFFFFFFEIMSDYLTDQYEKATP